VLHDKAAAPKDINKLNEYTIWDISADRFAGVAGKKVFELTRADVAAARAEVQRRIADEADGPVFVKTHNALVLDRGHPTINFGVTAGAIYIIRNPLDVVISFAHHFGIDIDRAIARMQCQGAETDMNEQVAYEVYGSWSEHVWSWTRKPHQAIQIIRYEDMIARPCETFSALARHLLIDATPAQIDRAIELSSFAAAKAQEQEKGYRERPKQSQSFFREGRCDQWRDVLTPEQVQRVVAANREQMARFGYVPDG
jgi:hypothetical protein